MSSALKRFTVTPWFGEARNVFYVMRNNPCDPTDWEIVASYPDRDSAVRDASRRNGAV